MAKGTKDSTFPGPLGAPLTTFLGPPEGARLPNLSHLSFPPAFLRTWLFFPPQKFRSSQARAFTEKVFYVQNVKNHKPILALE